MNETISYRDIDTIMRSFGFKVAHAPGRWRRYTHTQSPSILLLPDRPLDAAASPFHWMSARSALADFGFIRDEDFPDVVRNHGRVAS